MGGWTRSADIYALYARRTLVVSSSMRDTQMPSWRSPPVIVLVVAVACVDTRACVCACDRAGVRGYLREPLNRRVHHHHVCVHASGSAAEHDVAGCIYSRARRVVSRRDRDRRILTRRSSLSLPRRQIPDKGSLIASLSSASRDGNRERFFRANERLLSLTRFNWHPRSWRNARHRDREACRGEI